jgi:hypothetical protein
MEHLWICGGERRHVFYAMELLDSTLAIVGEALISPAEPPPPPVPAADWLVASEGAQARAMITPHSLLIYFQN